MKQVGILNCLKIFTAIVKDRERQARDWLIVWLCQYALAINQSCDNLGPTSDAQICIYCVPDYKWLIKVDVQIVWRHQGHLLRDAMQTLMEVTSEGTSAPKIALQTLCSVALQRMWQ